MDKMVERIYFNIFLCLEEAGQFSGKITKFRIQIWSKLNHILIVIWHNESTWVSTSSFWIVGIKTQSSKDCWVLNMIIYVKE